jgi:hypothetical protein
VKNIKLAATIIAALLTGCVTAPMQMYDGKKIAPSSEAVILGQGDEKSFLLLDKVFITKVDSRSTYKLRNQFNSSPHPQIVYVRPGRHTISVKYINGPEYSSADLWLETEAGGQYLVRAIPKDNQVFFRIENTVSGEVVGGLK